MSDKGRRIFRIVLAAAIVGVLLSQYAPLFGGEGAEEPFAGLLGHDQLFLGEPEVTLEAGLEAALAVEALTAARAVLDMSFELGTVSRFDLLVQLELTESFRFSAVHARQLNPARGDHLPRAGEQTPDQVAVFLRARKASRSMGVPSSETGGAMTPSRTAYS